MTFLLASCYLIPALVWGIIAHESAAFWRYGQPSSRLFRLVPLLTLAATGLYLSMATIVLLPLRLLQEAPWPVRALLIVNYLGIIVGEAVGLHVVQYLRLPEVPPTRRWLVINYAAAAIVGLIAILALVTPAPGYAHATRQAMLVRNTYALVMIALMLVGVARAARPGRWRPGSLGDMRSPDVALLACGLLGATGWLILGVVLGSTGFLRGWVAVYDLLVGLVLSAVLAVRALGEVVRRFVLAVTMALGAGAVILAGLYIRPLAPEDLRPLVDVATVAALLAVLVPGQSAARATIDRVLFRRTRQRREELQAFFHGLSPELGTAECCRRALAELARVMRLRGAAILLADGTSFAQGVLTRDGIERAWPRPDTPPPRALWGYALRELPESQRRDLVHADVSAVLPVASPRRGWGTLFIATGFLFVGFDEDVPVIDAFTDRLGLVLDGAELLARTVAVERSLAHAEKLAAIGELAARFAHDIRNPVTAARSLAQQLSREPDSPFNAEHARLVVAELDRVEQRVRALLRFARRESFTFEPVDLAELARSTLEELRRRLDAAGVEVQVSAATPLLARADREKLRHVVVNLLENALDALADVGEPRRLSVTLASSNGSAILTVTDSGLGVPADALPRLFEPFFSLKSSGTGLGLAIARRTVEAHGGEIAAEPAPGSGMTFRVTLPTLPHAAEQ